MRNNILLFILVLTISFATASYVGGWYDKIDPQRGGWFWGPSNEEILVFVGFLISYVFFVSLMFELLSKKNKNKWIVWSLIPIVLLYAGYNWKLLYIPILTSIAGYILAKLIQFTIFKLKRPNPS